MIVCLSCHVFYMMLSQGVGAYIKSKCAALYEEWLHKEFDSVYKGKMSMGVVRILLTKWVAEAWEALKLQTATNGTIHKMFRKTGAFITHEHNDSFLSHFLRVVTCARWFRGCLSRYRGSKRSEVPK